MVFQSKSRPFCRPHFALVAERRIDLGAENRELPTNVFASSSTQPCERTIQLVK